MSVNKVILIGNLGKDPEVRWLDSGAAVCSFSVATSRQWKNSEGERQEETEWHRISVFGKLAEVCGEYLKKGRTAYIEGRLRTRQYEREGVTHYVTEIVAEEVKFLGGKRDDEGGGGQQRSSGGYGQQRGGGGQQQQRSGGQQRQQSAPKSNTGFDDMDDDIPF